MKRVKMSLLICLLIIAGSSFMFQNVFAMNSEQCKQCHQDVKKSWEESGHANMGIGCLSCHKSNMKLRQDKKKICSTCHSTGEIKANGSIGMPQKEVFEGVPNFWIGKQQMMPHNANDVNCVDCHMPGESKNHTFEIVMPYQKETKNTSEDEKERNKSCITSCHTIIDPDLVQRRLNKSQDFINDLLGETEKLLENKKGFKDQKAYQKAQMMYTLVKKDGSKGIHNQPYVTRVLRRSIRELKKLKKPKEK